MLAPSEIQELHPYLYTEDIQGGVWVPEDATVHPKKVSVSLQYEGWDRTTTKIQVLDLKTH